MVSGVKEEDDRLVLNESVMLPVLWAALKELISRVEQLEGKKEFPVRYIRYNEA